MAAPATVRVAALPPPERTSVGRPQYRRSMDICSALRASCWAVLSLGRGLDWVFDFSAMGDSFQSPSSCAVAGAGLRGHRYPHEAEPMSTAGGSTLETRAAPPARPGAVSSMFPADHPKSD